MRKLRELQQGVWYEIRTRINNREPLFRRPDALDLFAGVFREAEERYGFAVCGLHLEDDRLTFYIKPEDGFRLPEIMKWMKQVFAVRFNGIDGRTGHIWGDRYWSQILKGEPPKEGPPEGKETEVEAKTKSGVRPRYGKNAVKSLFSAFFPLFGIHPPG
jgi:REP element-mobilizing transposase RayT